jgi:hypothetical protein
MCGTVAWLRVKACGDDEQFDLAAWFPSLWIQSWSRVASFFHILIYRFPLNSFLSVNSPLWAKK